LPALVASDAVEVTTLLVREDEKRNGSGPVLHEGKAHVDLREFVVAAEAIGQGVAVVRFIRLSWVRILSENLTVTPAPPVMRAAHLELGICI